MDKHYTYLVVDMLTVLFPFLLSFDRKVSFRKCWKYLWPAMLVTAVFFISWDMLFTWLGVWSFNPEYLTGPAIGNLPIEEVLFFLVVPYSCAFIYECLIRYFPVLDAGRRFWLVYPLLGIALVLTSIILYNKAYTFSSFFLCGVALMIVYALRGRIASFRPDAFLFMYLISLIPFFIVNGILTSLPVVVYNDAENIGVRLYTIPFEDCFYGMLLMLGNVFGMEAARSRR
jgi:lycopene cyclase domain-containing protein